MAGTFIVGETKIRPGTYFNIQKVGENQIVGASDGVVAIFFKSDFGPLAQEVEITSEEGYEKLYGTAGSTNAIREVIRAGATKCVCVRVGKGGTAATVTLDKDGDTEALKITAKYPGAKDFAITVREKLSDSSLKECIIYSGAKEFEKLEFAAGDDEVKALNDAFDGVALGAHLGFILKHEEEPMPDGLAGNAETDLLNIVLDLRAAILTFFGFLELPHLFHILARVRRECAHLAAHAVRRNFQICSVGRDDVLLVGW